MKKPTILITIALLLMCVPFQMGCSDGEKPPLTAKSDMARVTSSLKKAKRTHNPKAQIYFLRTAYDQSLSLRTDWPGSEKVPVFFKKHGDSLRRVPGKVYRLSMQTKDLDSFKWALAHSAPLDTQHSELLKFWDLDAEWQDYIVSEDPEILSIFMDRAIEDYNVKFFNRHVGAFKASGFKLVFPLEKTEFNARFCRFISNMFDWAMQKENPTRIEFLLDHMPTFESVIYIDKKTERAMRTLGDYLFHDLRDEALACKLVELGYDLNPLDLSTISFGTDFYKALEADPEYALNHVLKLNEWRGSLSEEELHFLLSQPNPLLKSIHPLHIDEAIEATIKKKTSEDALRLIQLREETRPLTDYDYDQLLGWSLESGNRAVFAYIKPHYAELDLFSLDLTQLAGNKNLFRLYAPQILKRVYKTMDKNPKSDGTTFGRVHDLLISNHPEAVLYVVQNYDFGGAWTEVTGGRTLLMDVCEGGNLEAAKYLIEKKGADVHAQTGYAELQVTIFGRSESVEGKLSPLFFAAKSGNSELIEYLASKLLFHVNPRSSYGATPLMYAVSGDHLEATKTLIALGARVNAAMNENLTHRELMELGAYADISTAYRRARKNGNQEILSVLKQAGARL